MPLQDEDLLDLMVRIAQSPAEWERIQKVLSKKLYFYTLLSAVTSSIQLYKLYSITLAMLYCIIGYTIGAYCSVCYIERISYES